MMQLGKTKFEVCLSQEVYQDYLKSKSFKKLSKSYLSLFQEGTETVSCLAIKPESRCLLMEEVVQ